MDPLRTEFEFPERKRTVDFYPLRVWLSTLFFGPVIIVLAGGFTREGPIESATSIAGLFFVCSLLVTLPFLCIHWYLYDLLVERKIKNVTVRVTLCLVVGGMVLLIFGLFRKSFFEDMIMPLFACAYIVANVVSTWVFNFADEKNGRIESTEM
jgi:hypothetical protein